MPDPTTATISDPQSLVDAALSGTSAKPTSVTEPVTPPVPPTPSAPSIPTPPQTPESVATPSTPEPKMDEVKETVPPAPTSLPPLTPLTTEPPVTPPTPSSTVAMGDETPLAFVTPPPTSAPTPTPTTNPEPIVTSPIPPAPPSPPITTTPKKKKKVGLVVGGVMLLLLFVFGGVAGYQYYSTGEIAMIAKVEDNRKGQKAPKVNQKDIVKGGKSGADRAIRIAERTGTCAGGVKCIPDLVQEAANNQTGGDINKLSVLYNGEVSSSDNTTALQEVGIEIKGTKPKPDREDFAGSIADYNAAMAEWQNDVNALKDLCGATCKDGKVGAKNFGDFLKKENVTFFFDYVRAHPDEYCDMMGPGSCVSGDSAMYNLTLQTCAGKPTTGSGAIVCENTMGGDKADKTIPGGNFNTIDCRINPSTGKYTGGASYDYCAPTITATDGAPCDASTLMAGPDLAQIYLNSPQHENANGTFIGCKPGIGTTPGQNCFCKGSKISCIADAGGDSCGAPFDGTYVEPKTTGEDDDTPNPSVPPSTPPTIENPAMSCTGLTSVPVVSPAPAVGAKLTFTCVGVVEPPEAGTLSYKFRYSLNSGSYVTMTNKTATTAELNVAACGTYKVQCQACATLNGVLTCDPTWTGATP